METSNPVLISTRQFSNENQIKRSKKPLNNSKKIVSKKPLKLISIYELNSKPRKSGIEYNKSLIRDQLIENSKAKIISQVKKDGSQVSIEKVDLNHEEFNEKFPGYDKDDDDNNNDYDTDKNDISSKTKSVSNDDDETDIEEAESSMIILPDLSDKNTPLYPNCNDKIDQELRENFQKFYRSTPDIEDEDTWDSTMVSEYSSDIFKYLKELEIKFAPSCDYIPRIQSQITWEHRSTLIGWLVEVHNRLNLLPETLFLTINLTDRFLSKKMISLGKFQLCGIVALFIASKYEEVYCPSVKQMIRMISNDYTSEDLLSAERFMIDELNFQIGYSGPMSFLRKISKADSYNLEIRTLAKYFLEITIMDRRFVASPPSWLAAGASYLSRKILSHGTWSEEHVFYSGYTESQIKPLAIVLIDCCLNYKNHHKVIFEKYADRKYQRASIFVQKYLTKT